MFYFAFHMNHLQSQDGEEIGMIAHFHAPVTLSLGHIVLPLSVHMSCKFWHENWKMLTQTELKLKEMVYIHRGKLPLLLFF